MPATLTPSPVPTPDQIPAVTLCQIMEQTTAYAVEVEGNQLAPKYRHGQTVTLHPALCVEPATIPAGTLVLAVLEHPHRPNQYHHFGLFTLTAEGALQSGECRIEAGAFLVLGVEASEAPTPRTDADRYADCFDDRHDGRPYHDPPMGSYQWHLMQ